MGAVIIRRLIRLIPQLLILVTIAFALVHLTPGSTGSVNVETGATQNLEQMRAELGLDRPLYIQYLDWLARVARFDLGDSFVDGQPVVDTILSRLPATILLTLTALVLSVLLALVIGVISAVRQNTWVDYLGTVISFFGLSIPSFWFGLMLIMVFAVGLHWFPAQGMRSIGVRDPVDVAWHLVLPAFVLALDGMAALSRYVRSSMIEALGDDYVRTARSKGLSEWAVIVRHAMRNALLPTITVLGMRLPILVGGALLIETVFAWPGIGRLGYEAVTQRDYPVILGLLLLTGVITILGNLLADIGYALVDPRVELEG